ncbi:MAG: tRNA (adenosine(37)-N6)-threonylcarbamoyltransferase complex ATPase subunit type 1 TsaE [Nitrospinota bacterium]
MRSNLTKLDFISRSANETFRIGVDFARKLSKGDIVGLEGDLGVGKTLFVKGVCRGLNFDNTDLVRSPSYTLINHYRADNLLIRHADLYRLEALAELDSIDLFDSHYQESILLIEWSDRLADLSTLDYTVRIKEVDDNSRLISIEKRRSA